MHRAIKMIHTLIIIFVKLIIVKCICKDIKSYQVYKQKIYAWLFATNS